MRRSAFHFELFFPSPFGASGVHQASVVRRMSVNRHVAGSKSGPGNHFRLGLSGTSGGALSEADDSLLPPLRPLPLGQGAAEPVLEMRLTKARVIAGDEGAFAKCRAEVARLRISDNLAPIVVRFQAESDERVEPELFRSPDFNRAVYRRADRDHTDRFGDVVSRDWLNECRWHPDGVAVGGAVGDAGDEFKELRRATIE